MPRVPEPAVRDPPPAERQAADRRSVGTVDVIGIAIEGDRAAVQIFPLRDGRLVDRYGFHLENVEGRTLGDVLEAFCLEYYGSAPSIPPQLVVPPDAGDTAALEAVPLRAPGRAGRGAHARARREAAAAGARRPERAATRSTPTCSSPSSAACAGSRRSRSCARR